MLALKVKNNNNSNNLDDVYTAIIYGKATARVHWGHVNEFGSLMSQLNMLNTRPTWMILEYEQLCHLFVTLMTTPQNLQQQKYGSAKYRHVVYSRKIWWQQWEEFSPAGHQTVPEKAPTTIYLQHQSHTHTEINIEILFSNTVWAIMIRHHLVA